METAQYFKIRRHLTLGVKEVLAEEMHLGLQTGDLDEDAPLFGGGLGLDSLDALELVVAIEAKFDPDRSLSEAGHLFSINTLVDFLMQEPRLVSDAAAQC